jgi:hypothetical protein
VSPTNLKEGLFLKLTSAVVWLISRMCRFFFFCVSNRWYIQDSTMDMPLTVSHAITANGKWELGPSAARCNAATLVIGSLLISQTATGKGVVMVSQMFGLQIHLKVTQILCLDVKIWICSVPQMLRTQKQRLQNLPGGSLLRSWVKVWIIGLCFQLVLRQEEGY